MVTAKTKFNSANAHCMDRESDRAPSSAAGFLNQKQLLARLPISRRTLFNWRITGKIPCVRLDRRRLLFHWPSVEAALLRHQHGGQS
jgi:hypothetical protein